MNYIECDNRLDRSCEDCKKARAVHNWLVGEGDNDYI